MIEILKQNRICSIEVGPKTVFVNSALSGKSWCQAIYDFQGVEEKSQMVQSSV